MSARQGEHVIMPINYNNTCSLQQECLINHTHFLFIGCFPSKLVLTTEHAPPLSLLFQHLNLLTAGLGHARLGSPAGVRHKEYLFALSILFGGGGLIKKKYLVVFGILFGLICVFCVSGDLTASQYKKDLQDRYTFRFQQRSFSIITNICLKRF